MVSFYSGNMKLISKGSSFHIYEAFQGVLVTSDIAQKCGDNLFLIHRQATKTDRKRVAICDNDNPFLLSTKRLWIRSAFFESVACVTAAVAQGATATSLPGSVIPL